MNCMHVQYMSPQLCIVDGHYQVADEGIIMYLQTHTFFTPC